MVMVGGTTHRWGQLKEMISHLMKLSIKIKMVMVGVIFKKEIIPINSLMMKLNKQI